MSDLSPRLALPYLAPGQAQKHVTHNAALDRLDLLVQLVVEAFGAQTPPGTPQDGQAWALGAAPTGAWGGQGGRIAAWQGGGWVFVAPDPGWLAYGVDSGEVRVWDGSSWVVPPVPDSLQNLARLGLGTTADATHRLAVASPGSLFTHAGSGDHRMAVNKATLTDTASLTFQTGFSGRAEMGLTGADDLALKVSADGSTWATALTMDAASGRVGLPQGVDAAAFTLRDFTDPTRAAAFSAAQIGPNTTRSYTLPNTSGTLALLQGAQEFSGALTLAGGATVAGAFAADRLGLGGASADATNRLSVNAPATLFNHAGAGHEAVLNKAAAANDATLAFKTGFSARALIGLLADDDLTLKVSPDGSLMRSGLVVHRDTGRVSLPQHPKFAGFCNYDHYAAAGAWFTVDINNADHNDQGALAGGIFTAPHAGVYAFGAGCRLLSDGTPPTLVSCGLSLNNADPLPRHMTVNGAGASTPDSTTALTVTALLKLLTGDTVRMKALFTGEDSSLQAGYSVFWGHQVP